MDERRCFNCLWRGHAGKNCQSPLKCYKWKGRHNNAICYKLDNTAIIEKETPTADKSITTATRKEKSNVFLRTAKTNAFGDVLWNTIPIHILPGSDSQRTYFSDEFKTKLRLKTEELEVINLSTFETERLYSKKHYKHVVINVEVEDKIITFKALSFPQLCSINRNVDISR